MTSCEQYFQQALKDLLHQDIYIANMPNIPNVIGVRRTGGRSEICYNRRSNPKMKKNNMRISRPSMQVFVQNPVYEEGLNICERIVDEFDGISHIGFSSFLNGGIIPLGTINTNKGESFMFSINFDCVEDT